MNDVSEGEQAEEAGRFACIYAGAFPCGGSRYYVTVSFVTTVSRVCATCQQHAKTPFSQMP